jgi:hypothetical protein
MYQSFTTKSGAEIVAASVAAFPVTSGPDGLVVDPTALSFPGTATMPPRLYNWLVGLRLLSNVPLSYLVPDSALLPAESIRFFNLDPTWVDRVIDGVFSAANTGTVDITYSAAMLASVRAAIDTGVGNLVKQQVPGSSWTPANGLTGMLIRSDLVRRWPDVIVRAYAGLDEKTAAVIPVLRAETVSNDVYIAVFAGTPALVQLREPHVGVRFGLETNDQKSYFYEQRNASDGSLTNATTPVHMPVTLKPDRVVPVASIASDSRTVAIELMRQPFVQQFLSSVTEPRGSTNPPRTVSFGGIRVANVAALTTRLAVLQRLGQS